MVKPGDGDFELHADEEASGALVEAYGYADGGGDSGIGGGRPCESLI